MQRLLTILIVILYSQSIYAQSLKKYPISTTGCTALFCCDPGKFTDEFSPDSSRVYTAECMVDDMSFGIICVKLKDPINNMQASEEVLERYLMFLKESLSIVSNTGYSKGLKLKNKEDTRGIIDYWKDKDNENWKIQAWINGKYISVLYVYTKKEIPEAKANSFLNGFLFPGM